ncbi:MAG: helix-turn-helix transcriptional regulator [Bacteroidales bacterium]
MTNKNLKPHAVLTKRQLQVLEANVLGYSVKEISQVLGCEESTVATHIKRIKEKTGAQKNTELSLIWFCRCEGITIEELIKKRLLPMILFIALSIFQSLSGQDMIRSGKSMRSGRGRREVELSYDKNTSI